MKNVIITLSWNELTSCGMIGVLRKVASLQADRKDNAFGPSDWNIDIDGAAAEMAVGKYFNIFCVPSINTFKKPDVGGYQVRSTTLESGRLIVREKDKEADTFILVICKAPAFRLVGCFGGKEAKAYPYGDCWMVPQDKLRDLPEQNAVRSAAA